MNILLIPSMMLPIPPVRGGAVQNLVNFFIEWNEESKKHQLHVISIFDSSAKEQATTLDSTHIEFVKINNFLIKIRDHNLYKMGGIAYRFIDKMYLFRLKKYVKKNADKLDLIVFDNTPNYLPAIQPFFSGKKIVHIYNDYLNQQVKNIDKIMEYTDNVLVVSEYNAKIVKSLGYETPVDVLYNAVKIEKYKKKYWEERRLSIREKFGYNIDEVVILFVARLVPEKGIKELIQSFCLLNDIKNIRLVVVGNKVYGGNVVDEFSDSLIKESENSTNRIDFVGYVEYALLPEYYASSDIGVLPSVYEEPFAMAAIEYMAAGLGVIVTNSGGLPEMVQDTGLVVSKETNLVKNLETAIRKLVTDTEYRIDLGRKAEQRANLFDENIYCEKLNQFFEDIVKNR